MQKNSMPQELNSVGDKIIFRIVEKNKERGVSITEIVEISNLSRSAIRIILAKFEGAGIVEMRQAGMTKLYFLNQKNNAPSHLKRCGL